MPRFLRLFLISFGILLFLVLLIFGAGIAIVYQKQGQLVQQALAEYNEDIAGRLSLEYSKVSPFANFPYISIDLHGIKAYETKLDTLPLLYFEDVYIGFDVLKLIKGELEIAKVKISEGHVDLVMHTDTTYNLLNAILIQEEKESEQESTQVLAFELKALELKNISLRKFSELDSSTYSLKLNRINSGLSKTETAIYANVKGDLLLSAFVNDVALANEKPIAFQTQLDYVKKEQLLKISPSELYVQGVYFSFSGSADIDNDMDLDLRIRGEKEDFSLFFALLPEEFMEFVNRYSNAGNIYFDASIKGKSTNAHIPQIEARFGCRNGYFQNTNVNRTVNQLTFNGYYTNGAEGTLQSSEFRLLDFNAVPEQGIVKANLILRDLLDPYVDLKVYTDFDLQFLADFFQLNTLQGLAGQVLLDVNYDELVDISKPEMVLEGVQQGIDSKLEIKNLRFEIPGHPIPVEKVNLLAKMVDGYLKLDTFAIQMGESRMQMSGFVSNLPDLLHQLDRPIDFGLEIQSDFIDLLALTDFDTTLMRPINEQIEDLRSSFVFKGNARELSQFDYLPKGDFLLDNFYLKLKNYAHTFHDFDMHVVIDEENIELKNWRGEIDASDFALTAKVFNYPKWMKDTTDGQSRVQFNLTSNHLHPGDLLSYNGVQYLPKEYVEEDIRQLRMNGSLDLDYQNGALSFYDLVIDDAKALLTVHPLKLEGIKGRLHGEDGILNTDDFMLRMGHSDIRLSMKYHFTEELKHLQNQVTLSSSMLDFDELTNYQLASATVEDTMNVHAEAFNIFQLPFSNTQINLDIAELKYHKIWISNLKSQVRMTEDHYLHVDQMDMDIAGGHLALSGYLNGSDPDNIYFSPRMLVQNIDLNQVLIKADNFGQEYLINENIKGILTGSISGTIKLYPDLYPILESSDLEMDIMIKNGVMVNYAPLQMLGSFFADRNLNYVRFDTLQNTFTLKNNELLIPAMTINSSLGFIEISGMQSLDMNMNYLLRIPWNVVTNAGVQKLFGRRNKAEVPEDQIDEIVMRDTGRRVRFLNVRLTGTPDDYNVALGKGREHRRAQ